MVRQRKITPQLAVIRPRTQIIFFAAALLYVALCGRLVFLQAIRHHAFQKQADLYRVRKRLLPAQRGTLLDRNGQALAVNIPANVVYADPQLVTDPAGTAAQLAPILDEPSADLQKKLTPLSPKTHYVLLARHLLQKVGDKIKTANLPGISVEADTRRAYPNGLLAAQALGFTDADGRGAEGLESSQNALMTGSDGEVVAEIDKSGRFLPGTERQRQEARNGSDILLTLDLPLQQAADAALAQTVKDHHAESGVLVMEDPRTGEILALSNMPTFDPNAPRPPGPLDKDQADAVMATWRDRVVSDVYEPGSTLKPITASAVLQAQGLGMMNVHVYCGSPLRVGKHIIHEAHDGITTNLGSLDLRGILRVSSNTGMAQFGLRLGAKPLYTYEQKFGFLDKPGTGLPGEVHSPLKSPDEFNKYTGSVGWSKIQLANIAFGQGISVTPLQLVSAYSAIANDGVMMQPHIIREIIQDGKTHRVVPQVVRRVVDSNVAAKVRSMLGTVVQDGTGKPAQIAGYSVGGKTGSAQVAGPHGYENGHFVGSFVGMVPLSHPRVVILCAVFKPQGIYWGAVVAAPVVHDLEKLAMRELCVAPDAPNLTDFDDHSHPATSSHHRATRTRRHQRG